MRRTENEHKFGQMHVMSKTEREEQQHRERVSLLACMMHEATNGRYLFPQAYIEYLAYHFKGMTSVERVMKLVPGCFLPLAETFVVTVTTSVPDSARRAYLTFRERCIPRATSKAHNVSEGSYWFEYIRGVSSTEQLHELLAAKHFLEQDRLRLLGENDRLHAERMNAAAHIANLNGQVNALTGQVNFLTGQVNSLTRQVNDLTGQLGSLPDYARTLEGQVRDLERVAGQQRERATRAEAEAASLRRHQPSRDPRRQPGQLTTPAATTRAETPQDFSRLAQEHELLAQNYARLAATAANEICPICLESFSAPSNGSEPSGSTVSRALLATKCNHLFHRACLTRWSAHSDRCPMCQKRGAVVRP